MLLQAMLASLNIRTGSVYAIAFIFTNSSLLKQLLTLQKAGVPVHILHDLSQWNSDQLHRFTPLIQAGCDLTLATSTYPDSQTKEGYDACHEKSLLINLPFKPTVYTGSANFTANGYQQVGDVAKFSDKVWRDNFINRFQQLRAFSRDKLARYQVT